MTKTRSRVQAKRGLESLLLKALREGRAAVRKKPHKSNEKLIRKIERALINQRRQENV